MASSSDNNSSGTGGGSKNNNNPFAWLGLLKWSLSYTDGTKPTTTTTTTTTTTQNNESCNNDDVDDVDKDKLLFLENVMKDGLLDENERMKTILKLITNQIEIWITTSKSTTNDNDDDIDQVIEWFEELRDIVEQIDYAKAFAVMGGIQFLLGCIQQQQEEVVEEDPPKKTNNNNNKNNKKHMIRSSILPQPIKYHCLGILATMSQHNPTVQNKILELGGIKILCDVYFRTTRSSHGDDDNDDYDDKDGQYRARIIQAISACVRSNEMSESIFCQLEQSNTLLEMGLGGINNTNNTTNNNSNSNEATATEVPVVPIVLRKRTLFFLHALITSDTATKEHIQRFDNCVATVIDQFIVAEVTQQQQQQQQQQDALESSSQEDWSRLEIREMTLLLMEQILEQKKHIDVVMSRKDHVVGIGVSRIEALRTQVATTTTMTTTAAAATAAENNSDVVVVVDDDDDDTISANEEIQRWERILALYNAATTTTTTLNNESSQEEEQQQQQPTLLLGPPPSDDMLAQ